MVKNFANKDRTLLGRKRFKRFENIERVALRKLVMLQAAADLCDLEIPPGNPTLDRLMIGPRSVKQP